MRRFPRTRGWPRRALGTLLAVAAGAGLTLAPHAAPAAARTVGTTVHASAACAPGRRGGRFVATVTVGRNVRTAVVNVPPQAAAGQPLPLVFAFHGAGGTGPFMEGYTGLSDLANRYGFIAVYPTANGKYWDLGTSEFHDNQDVTYIRALLDDLDQQLCVDDGRVFATGVSNGGGFTALLGCELSDRLAAIAPVAGYYGIIGSCVPDRPLSVLEIHGTADRSVPYNGDSGTGRGSVNSFLSLWEGFDQCPPGATAFRHLGRRALMLDRDGCAAGTAVSHLKLIGGPHIWPGTSFVTPGRSSGVPVSASLAVWAFFTVHQLAPPGGVGQAQARAHKSRARV